MAKTQGHGRVLEALLASSESPVAAAQSLLDSAVAAGRAFDVVSSGGTLHMSTAFDQSSASGMNTEDGDGLAFLVSLLGLDGQGSKGEEGVSSASEPVDGEGAEASVTGIAGLEPSKATEERKHTKCDAVDEITSSGNVASNALSGVTVGCGFEQGGASGAMGSGKVFTRGMSMLANMGGGDCKGGSGRVGGADYGEKRSRGHEGVSSELGGAGVCSGGKGRTLDCLRSSRGTQDGGCAVQHRRRSVAQSIPGRQVYEKKGYLPFTSEEGRGDDAGLQGTSNHGSGAWGVGFLPSILLNDSALALQTALVALLQLQKQDEEGVKQEPVIPRRYDQLSVMRIKWLK
ncbi:putative zinc finger (CCCH type) protein [Neospora caninum Liverpool]|uniref:Putative zinc finger (CCCH type) protein n=1 Tax=Neospora caninum (strain Liverpool) TaxID=572307 RepID=F0VE04_NEOCL|nr:putative zinc finger (CCCH type) protein [Neospora caninum Liverpool]CBZ51947.1 putative zinc finger (CCCH type) protein [Neospora caninum Liverpool]|eukprot:XP_003881980.1 putative zinc finger (CCCH type) protein [Neospora caninum Liverpool]